MLKTLGLQVYKSVACQWESSTLGCTDALGLGQPGHMYSFACLSYFSPAEVPREPEEGAADRHHDHAVERIVSIRGPAEPNHAFYGGAHHSPSLSPPPCSALREAKVPPGPRLLILHHLDQFRNPASLLKPALPLPPLPPPLLQFLCNGLEEDMALRRAMAQSTSDERELMERASGKMVLLAKLLPKLRAEGRR